MGYDFNDEHSTSTRPRSRKRGQSINREPAPRPARQVQEIPPPGGWDNSSRPSRAGWSHSEGSRQKPTLALDPSLKNGGRKGMSRTKRRIITMLIAECFALLFIGGYGYWARTWNRMQKMDDWVPEEIQNQNFSVDLPQYEKQKGHWGIYIFGVDSRGTNVGKDTHSDVNIVCDINHDTGEIRLVSVFRDSYLNINDKNEYNKINQAYFRGGPADTAKALNKNLDLNILDYVTFNWKAVADGINILGGVDMEISRAEYAYINSFITETVKATGVYSEHLKGPGPHHLDGVQAVAYGRLRLMDTDYARTERQRKVIQAAFEKAKSADINTLNKLALAIFPQVATSVDFQDILQLLGNVGNYYIGETGGFPFARGDANMGRKGACVIPQTLEGNVIELHEFLYGQEDYTPSDTVKTISAKISSDTGMYNQGVSIDHVSTTGGSVPRPVKPQETEKPKETKASAKTEEADEEEDREVETGEDGEPIEPQEDESVEEASQEEISEPVEKKPTSTLYPDESRIQERPKPTETTSLEPGSTAPLRPTEGADGPTQERQHPSSSAPAESLPVTENHPSAGNRPTESRPTEGQPSENRPTESQPTESRPAESQPTESRPTESHPSESRPTESQPSENRPTESHPGSTAQPGQNVPDVPSPTAPKGPTSVIIPDDQVISYDGPPGAGN